MAKRIGGLFLLLVALVGTLAACERVPEQYHAFVDRIEPPIPGLSVIETKYFWGGIEIVNRTGMEVYVYDWTGQEAYRLTAEESFGKDEQGNWKPYGGNSVAISWPNIEYIGSSAGLPKGKYRGQVMKEWVIEGRAGDTPFKIYGRTVYNPPPWDD